MGIQASFVDSRRLCRPFSTSPPPSGHCVCRVTMIARSPSDDPGYSGERHADRSAPRCGRGEPHAAARAVRCKLSAQPLAAATSDVRRRRRTLAGATARARGPIGRSIAGGAGRRSIGAKSAWPRKRPISKPSRQSCAQWLGERQQELDERAESIARREQELAEREAAAEARANGADAGPRGSAGRARKPAGRTGWPRSSEREVDLSERLADVESGSHRLERAVRAAAGTRSRDREAASRTGPAAGTAVSRHRSIHVGQGPHRRSHRGDRAPRGQGGRVGSRDCRRRAPNWSIRPTRSASGPGSWKSSGPRCARSWPTVSAREAELDAAERQLGYRQQEIDTALKRFERLGVTEEKMQQMQEEARKFAARRRYLDEAEAQLDAGKVGPGRPVARGGQSAPAVGGAAGARAACRGGAAAIASNRAAASRRSSSTSARRRSTPANRPSTNCRKSCAARSARCWRCGWRPRKSGPSSPGRWRRPV